MANKTLNNKQPMSNETMVEIKNKIDNFIDFVTDSVNNNDLPKTTFLKYYTDGAYDDLCIINGKYFNTDPHYNKVYNDIFIKNTGGYFLHRGENIDKILNFIMTSGVINYDELLNDVINDGKILNNNPINVDDMNIPDSLIIGPDKSDSCITMYNIGNKINKRIKEYSLYPLDKNVIKVTDADAIGLLWHHFTIPNTPSKNITLQIIKDQFEQYTDDVIKKETMSSYIKMVIKHYVYFNSKYKDPKGNMRYNFNEMMSNISNELNNYKSQLNMIYSRLQFMDTGSTLVEDHVSDILKGAIDVSKNPSNYLSNVKIEKNMPYPLKDNSSDKIIYAYSLIYGLLLNVIGKYYNSSNHELKIISNNLEMLSHYLYAMNINDLLKLIEEKINYVKYEINDIDHIIKKEYDKVCSILKDYIMFVRHNSEYAYVYLKDKSVVDERRSADVDEYNKYINDFYKEIKLYTRSNFENNKNIYFDKLKNVINNSNEEDFNKNLMSDYVIIEDDGVTFINVDLVKVKSYNPDLIDINKPYVPFEHILDLGKYSLKRIGWKIFLIDNSKSIVYLFNETNYIRKYDHIPDKGETKGFAKQLHQADSQRNRLDRENCLIIKCSLSDSDKKILFDIRPNKVEDIEYVKENDFRKYLSNAVLNDDLSVKGKNDVNVNIKMFYKFFIVGDASKDMKGKTVPIVFYFMKDNVKNIQ